MDASTTGEPRLHPMDTEVDCSGQSGNDSPVESPKANGHHARQETSSSPPLPEISVAFTESIKPAQWAEMSPALRDTFVTNAPNFGALATKLSRSAGGIPLGGFDRFGEYRRDLREWPRGGSFLPSMVSVWLGALHRGVVPRLPGIFDLRVYEMGAGLAGGRSSHGICSARSRVGWREGGPIGIQCHARSLEVGCRSLILIVYSHNLSPGLEC